MRFVREETNHAGCHRSFPGRETPPPRPGAAVPGRLAGGGSNERDRAIAPAQLIEHSHSGLRLRTGRHILPGTHVSVKWPAMIPFGEVRHCRRAAGGEFELGIKVNEVFGGETEGGTRHPTASALADFLASRLGDTEAVTLITHLKTCGACRERLGRLEEFEGGGRNTVG